MTEKQERFIDEYIIDFNATRAAIAAGYSSKRANSQGVHLLSIPEIQAEHVDAAIIHEAAIGRINDEQLLKLRTLGMTEAEAENVIIENFLS